MNDEPPKNKLPRPSLEARFASRPHAAARLHALADLMDAALARGATADEAEEIVLRFLRFCRQGRRSGKKESEDLCHELTNLMTPPFANRP